VKDSSKVIPAVQMLLEAIEGEPLRPQLLETPNRVMRALEEMLDGYNVEIDSLFKTFDDEGQDQIVVVKNIQTYSVCEHHLLPFLIQASVAYLPIDKVIGTSKIERLVLAFSHRLQLQERITNQVANTLMDKLQPQGVAVVIEGKHLCMRARGVKSKDSKVVTSVMLGEFRENPVLRQEFLSLVNK